MDRLSNVKVKAWVKVNAQLYVEVSYSIHLHNTRLNIRSELKNDKLSKVKLKTLRSKVQDA